MKSTPCIFPSAANDSDSDFPEYIAALPGLTYLPPAGLAGGRSANAIASPSTMGPQVEPIKTPEAEIIDIFGRHYRFYATKIV